MEALKVEDIDVIEGKEKVDIVKQETSEIIILSAISCIFCKCQLPSSASRLRYKEHLQVGFVLF